MCATNFQYCNFLVFWWLTIRTRQVLMISQKKQSSSNREWHGRTSAIHIIFYNFFCNRTAHHSDSQLFALLSRFRSHCILFVRCATAFCNAAHSKRHCFIVPLHSHCTNLLLLHHRIVLHILYHVLHNILYSFVSLLHCILIVQIYPFYMVLHLLHDILHVSLFHCFSVFQLYKSLPKPSPHCSPPSTWYSTRHCFRQRRLSDVTEKVAGVSMWGRRGNPSSSISSISTTKWWRTFVMWEGQGWKYSSSISSSSS